MDAKAAHPPLWHFRLFETVSASRVHLIFDVLFFYFNFMLLLFCFDKCNVILFIANA